MHISEASIEYFTTIVRKAAGQPGNWSGEKHAILLSDPNYAGLVHAVPDSEPLGKVLRGDALSAWTPGGSFSSVNPPGFIRALADDVLRMVNPEDSSLPDLDRLSKLVFSTFAKNLQDGTSVTERYMGLRGLTLVGDHHDIGLGVLRKISPSEAAHMRRHAGYPEVQDGEVVLQWNEKVTWQVGGEPLSSPRRHLANWMLLDLMLFVAGCRNSSGQLRVPQQIWTMSSPFFHKGPVGGGSNPDLAWRESGSVFDAIVDEEVASVANATYQALDSTFDGHLELFVHRLVSSLGVYVKSPENRLVDAAVAWESLLGQKDNNQLSLQLTLALAWLVEPTDPIKRLSAYRRLKKIYGVRSKVVHGASVPQSKVQSAFHDLAEYMRTACHSLIFERTELIGSQDRALDLLIGTHRNSR